MISRNRRRSRVRGRGRGRPGPTLAQTLGQSRLAGRSRDGASGGVIARAVLFGSAAFVFVYVVTLVLVVGSLIDVVAPVDRPGAAARASWLLIPLELGGMLGAFVGALLAGWLLADTGGERSPRRLFAWAMAGPLVVGFLLLLLGGFEGGPLRALLDLLVVAAGGWLGARLIVRRAAARA